MAAEPTCVWPLGAALGEGPLWDARAQRLRFVDIRRGRIHAYDPADGSHETVEIGGMPCFIVPSDDGGFVVGNHQALQRFDGRRIVATLKTIAMPAGNRLNDATVDPAGRLWFGTMDDAEAAASGLLHRHDDGVVTPVGGRAIVTNGPAVSADGRLLYHVDSAGGTIWRFVVADDGTLDEGTPFIRIDPADGGPDGVVLDGADHLWVALWGGWQARRYAPDGSLVQTVRFPCAQVTKLALGGADLRTAFVTTASVGLDATARATQPLAGGLFTFPVDVPGRLVPEAKLGAAR